MVLKKKKRRFVLLARLKKAKYWVKEVLKNWKLMLEYSICLDLFTAQETHGYLPKVY